jgi:hypothetical protein
MTFEYKYSAVSKTDDERLQELEEYLKALEEVHRKQSAEETPDADIIANLETEIEAKRTEFEGLGGTYE